MRDPRANRPARCPVACRRTIACLSVLVRLAIAPNTVEKPAWEANARAAAANLAAETFQSLIHENQVVIFSRSSRCSSCSRVKSYFEDLGIPYYALELDERDDGAALQKELNLPFGQGLPAVYIRGHHVGGSSDGAPEPTPTARLTPTYRAPPDPIFERPNAHSTIPPLSRQSIQDWGAAALGPQRIDNSRGPKRIGVCRRKGSRRRIRRSSMTRRATIRRTALQTEYQNM